MKRQPVDYSGFRLSRLGEPRFSHIRLLWSWPVYFALYLLTENLIAPENCHVVHIWLDDLIPFCEYFAVFYIGWFLLVFFSLAYYFFYNVPQFKRLQTYILITQLVAMAVYILWPSRQELRPEAFQRDNIFTQIMGLIYALDTSTGVCPSLHAAYSLGIVSVYSKDKAIPLWVKLFIGFFACGVCLAVCFVKQHSVLDVLAALPVCLFAEYCVYGRRHPLAAHRKMQTGLKKV